MILIPANKPDFCMNSGLLVDSKRLEYLQYIYELYNCFNNYFTSNIFYKMPLDTKAH